MSANLYKVADRPWIVSSSGGTFDEFARRSASTSPLMDSRAARLSPSHPRPPTQTV
ncbi:hypothetical protein HMPREF9603_01604 [Cutibacterium acnes HL001PA1]|nr:hypothetical protein HMPREF9603_01604 [Cutibacterium acnes HL001PA1]